MKYLSLTVLVLAAFSFVTVFGLPLMLSSEGHHHDCPFAQGVQLCKSSAIEHMGIWGSLLASILTALALFVCASFSFIAATAPLKVRYRHRTPLRPTLFQELFSQGILNRKEAYHRASLA